MWALNNQSNQIWLEVVTFVCFHNMIRNLLLQGKKKKKKSVIDDDIKQQKTNRKYLRP